MTGMALIIGGRLAAVVIGKVINLGLSYLGDNYKKNTQTREMLRNLEIQLPQIQSVVEAAEKRQITNEGLDTWLEQLKDAAYEAEDVLDHFETKRIHESINGKGKMFKNLVFHDHKDLKMLRNVVKKLDEQCMGVGNFIIALQAHSDEGKEHLGNNSSETSSYLAPRGEEEGSSSLTDKIFKNWFRWGVPGKGKLMFKTVKKGDAPEQSKKGLLGFIESRKLMFSGTIEKGGTPQQSKQGLLGLSESRKTMASSTVEKGDVPEQSKNIVTTITSTIITEPHSISNQKLSVIPIVGLGGVGKTTVAKKIYNDERVKQHFALKAWVYVSENHDAKKIMQEMLCSYKVSYFVPEYSQNLNIVEEMLIETIKNQRFLLILDDLTDRTGHVWSRLRSVLYYGEVGSVVVVTTQSASIANAIGTLPEVKLDVLKPDFFWELFQYYAFGGFKFANLPLAEQEELKKIGKQIAEKLHGLPLAGEVIGTLLSTNLEKEFWEDTCRSDWWNIEGAREKILPSIGVGYNYLESKLKQCFVFCSIFPKQYVFERERLVQMWIAHGFIQPSKEEKNRLEKGEIRLEDIGRKWFGKLVDKIFFQPTLSDGKYVMHDLVRNLAIAVSSNEFCFVKSNEKHLPSSARYLGIDCDNSKEEWKCENSTRLRAMILFGNWKINSHEFISNIFANNKGLRMLDSSYLVLETNDPINAVCLLWHLRFVDLSFTGIKSIPDEFCTLCHLQVLDVRGCNFEKLPKGMNQLINLRHLYASSNTISLISGIGKLTKLQKLEEFRIGKREGHRISELKDMNEISGHLLRSKLQNLSTKEEVAESKLDQKKYLKSLELRFDYNDHSRPTTEVKMEILDALKLSPSLEILKVRGYNGGSLPGWMCSSHPGFYNLKVIHVSCFRLRSLPAFGELPSLEHLSFHTLSSFDKVGSEFYGSSDVIFPSLKELTFSQMASWRNWEDGEVGKTIFPHLKKLHLDGCWALMTLPLCSLTSVVELSLSQCWVLCNFQTVQMPSLAHFSITCQESVSIDCTRLKSLEVLHITDISCLVYFVGGLKYLVKLRELVIINSSKIRQTYEEYPLDEISSEEYDEQCLQSLTYLHLYGNGYDAESLRRLGSLPSLHTLLIEKSFSLYCNMEDEESWFNQLISLEKLEFRNCEMLSCLPSQLHFLTSLKKLRIFSCPELRSLPERGLPQNLTELYIKECPDLICQCQPNQGDDWLKISHIPFIHFNGEIGTQQIQSP